jgi:chemotaxis protein CheD
MAASKPSLSRFNPAVLPMEYMPRTADVSDENHSKHYLIPGRVFVTKEPLAISTIVGSGTSVCLWDPALRIGGANHFLLPHDDTSEVNTKFGNKANQQLLQEILAAGADATRLRAKIFGGSEPPTTFSSSSGTLGDRNVRVALQFLLSEGIRVAGQDTGGVNARKIVFHTDDGFSSVQKL